MQKRKIVVFKHFQAVENRNLCEAINKIHSKVLHAHDVNYKSTNANWLNKRNVTVFYAYDPLNNEILSAYRHEFYDPKVEIKNMPMLSGIHDKDEYRLLVQHLSDISKEGKFSEACGFWSPKNMKYKGTILPKLLLSYGIYISMEYGNENVVGLGLAKLSEYYASVGLQIDPRMNKDFHYGEDRYLAKFVRYNQFSSADLNKIVKSGIYHMKEHQAEIRMEVA